MIVSMVGQVAVELLTGFLDARLLIMIFGMGYFTFFACFFGTSRWKNFDSADRLLIGFFIGLMLWFLTAFPTVYLYSCLSVVFTRLSIDFTVYLILNLAVSSSVITLMIGLRCKHGTLGRQRFRQRLRKFLKRSVWRGKAQASLVALALILLEVGLIYPDWIFARWLGFALFFLFWLVMVSAGFILLTALAYAPKIGSITTELSEFFWIIPSVASIRRSVSRPYKDSSLIMFVVLLATFNLLSVADVSYSLIVPRCELIDTPRHWYISAWAGRSGSDFLVTDAEADAVAEFRIVPPFLPLLKYIVVPNPSNWTQWDDHRIESKGSRIERELIKDSEGNVTGLIIDLSTMEPFNITMRYRTKLSRLPLTIQQLSEKHLILMNETHAHEVVVEFTNRGDTSIFLHGPILVEMMGPNVRNVNVQPSSNLLHIQEYEERDGSLYASFTVWRESSSLMTITWLSD